MTQPYEILVTDCLNCTLELRWNVLVWTEMQRAADDDCVYFSQYNTSYRPPVGDSPYYLFGQCHNTSENLVVFQEEKKIWDPVAVTVTAKKYVDVQMNTDLITLPVDLMDASVYSRVIVGARPSAPYAYFVAVAPIGGMIFVKTLRRDSRSKQTCKIEIFEGTVPSVDDSTNLIFTLGQNDTGKDMIWRMPIMTFRFSRGECYAQIEYRRFIEEIDANTCLLGNLAVTPFVFPIVSSNLREQIVESKCFVQVESLAKLVITLDKLIGGTLEIDFGGNRTEITADNSVTVICQKNVSKITYYWYPNLNEVESRILGRIVVNPIDSDHFCSTENTEANKSGLSKWAKVGIVIGATALTLILILFCFWCIRAVILSPNPKKKRFHYSYKSNQSDSILVFDDPIERIPSVSEAVHQYQNAQRSLPKF